MSGIRASRVSCARVAPRVRAGVSSVSVLRETNNSLLARTVGHVLVRG